MGTGIHDKIKEYEAEWIGKCYKKGLPDEAPIVLKDRVPSYKRIALCILQNDLRPLGYMKPKSKYYSILKRIEIDAREYNGKQLKLRI